jgi:hypothetical protein
VPLRRWADAGLSRLALLGSLAVIPTLIAASRPPPAAASPRARADQVLSNERTFTRWAHVALIAPVRRRPSASSPPVGRLHWDTEDGVPEVYLLLRAHWDAAGREWVRLRIPMRPNGSTGWVRRRDLGAVHLTHALITVDRARLRLFLSEHGRRVWSAPVAVGKASTPTPPGHFWIREKFKIENPRSGYGPYAMGTSDYSTLADWPGGGVVGLHGPFHEPWEIPGRVSHGCVRLRVADDAWLGRHVALGTPVHIL